MGLSRSANNLHNHRWMITLISVLVMSMSAFRLNTDGVLLLSFKYCVLSDPLMVLQSWNYEDQKCSWNGVHCSKFRNSATSSDPFDINHVKSLILPNNQLLGSIPADLGMIENLQQLDLSNNFLNGSLPASIFNVSELKLLSLSNNEVSGQLPEFVDGLKSLESLNLSDNALSGTIPTSLVSLKNLTVISLSRNYLSGVVPDGFQKLGV